MKKGWLILCLITTGAFVSAQDKQKIVGKWKVAAMYDDKMYFDFIKDSLHINKPVADGMTRQQTDSVHIQAKEIMQEFFRDAYFEFNADMTCAEHSEMQGSKEGFYTVNETTKIITVKKERKSKVSGEMIKTEENIPYSFSNNRLVFLSKGNDDGPNIELEKQQNVKD